MTRAISYAVLMGAFSYLMQWGVAADTATTITAEHWTRMLTISSAFTIFSLLIYYSDIFRARVRSLLS